MKKIGYLIIFLLISVQCLVFPPMPPLSGTTYDASNLALVFQASLNLTPMTETVTTEADITDPITSSVVLIVGDNDADNDAIDLQDGTTPGQILFLIASAGVDDSDTITINMADTTYTNGAAIVFDKVGENAHLIWTGTTWVLISLQDTL